MKKRSEFTCYSDLDSQRLLKFSKTEMLNMVVYENSGKCYYQNWWPTLPDDVKQGSTSRWKSLGDNVGRAFYQQCEREIAIAVFGIPRRPCTITVNMDHIDLYEHRSQFKTIFSKASQRSFAIPHAYFLTHVDWKVAVRDGVCTPYFLALKRSLTCIKSEDCMLLE